MASILPRQARLVTSSLRSQCLWSQSPAWRKTARFASTVTNTPSTVASDILPPTILNTLKASDVTKSTLSSQRKTPSVSHKHKLPGSSKRITARVTRAGYMDKTVRADVATHEWDNYLRKFYKSSRHLLVHDPANSLREGDMISVRRLLSPQTDRVRHVVAEILVPFGVDIADRPAVPTEADFEAEAEKGTAAKNERRETRRKAAAGDEAAVAKVGEEGIAVKEVVSGRGRSKRVHKVLEKDFVKGKK